MSSLENLKYIDCHSHPHDKKFIESGVDMDKLMQDLLDDGGATIAIGTDYKETENAINFAKKYANCWATIGIHPADNHKEVFEEEKFEGFLELGGGKIVGVGECGLDYFYFDKILKENGEFDIEKEKARQREIFVKQIEFACKHELPLVLHGRPSKNSMDAYRDMLDILESYAEQKDSSQDNNLFVLKNKLRGHAHFFVGNLEIAERFFKLGFLLSFDGPITFTNEYDAVIKSTPIENIMIETDSPYAAPAPYRGQVNYPVYVVEVAKKIAALKNLSVEEVLEITKKNTINLFNLN
jgi:TatD DNase family protein